MAALVVFTSLLDPMPQTTASHSELSKEGSAGTPRTTDSPSPSPEEDLAVDLRRSYTMPERDRSQNNSNAAAAIRATKSADPAIEKKLDKFGFIVNIDSQGHVFKHDEHDEPVGVDRVPTFAEAKRTARREQKWNSMVGSWERQRSRKLIRRLRKGIPDSQRGQVWSLLGGGVKEAGLYAKIVKQTAHVTLELEGAQGSNRSMSKKLSQGSSAGDNDSYSHTKAFRDIQNTIERDIHRTFPRHGMFFEDHNSSEASGNGSSSPSSAASGEHHTLNGLFDPELSDVLSNMEGNLNVSLSEGFDVSTQFSKRGPEGQAALRRVLRAYSYYDREVGYCQGMNFIAGMFLTLMSEEEAFWLLVAVMHNEPCNMHGLFGEGMRETHKVLHVAESLIHKFLPRLAKHFDKEHIHVTMYATQWLLTQYTSSFRFDLVVRVWDCFLGEGWKIIYRVMLALLQQWQSQLMRMSFEEILAFFRELPDRVDGNSIVEAALKIPLRRRQIATLEKEWKVQQNQQQTS